MRRSGENASVRLLSRRVAMDIVVFSVAVTRRFHAKPSGSHGLTTAVMGRNSFFT
jgi:hypothetical protein